MTDRISAVDPRIRIDAHGVPRLFGRLAGHALRAGGEPYLAVDCTKGRCVTNVRGTVRQEHHASDSLAGKGHALCECGALSVHLPSYRRRRRWSREHKARVLLGIPDPAGQPAPVDPAQVA